ncbi:MAG: hypothetical protein R3185_04325 [Candidatus Thermoplasmatota archaeon]|nr:hypothetical protein [Candidatus Thermoplasmatota archaeon]
MKTLETRVDTIADDSAFDHLWAPNYDAPTPGRFQAPPRTEEVLDDGG